MVERQLKKRGICNQFVLEAMRLLPREFFVPAKFQDDAYSDCALPIEEGQSISQPIVVAKMLEALNLRPEMKVLEIGCGSGYAAALLASIVHYVYAIEIQESLVNLCKERIQQIGINNLEIIHGDGSFGLSKTAPYDAILVSAAAEHIPENLKNQLAIGANLVIPVGANPDQQELLLINRISDKDYVTNKLGDVRFVPLVSH